MPLGLRVIDERFQFRQWPALLGRPSERMFMALIRWSKEIGIQTQPRDESGRVGKCCRQFMDGKGAVTDKDDFAVRQPTANLQNALPCPVCQQLVSAAPLLLMRSDGHRIVSTGSALTHLDHGTGDKTRKLNQRKPLALTKWPWLDRTGSR